MTELIKQIQAGQTLKPSEVSRLVADITDVRSKLEYQDTIIALQYALVFSNKDEELDYLRKKYSELILKFKEIEGLNLGAFVASIIFDYIKKYINREVDILGIKIFDDELGQAYQKSFEELSKHFAKHFNEIKEDLPFHLSAYAVSMALFFRGISLHRCSLLANEPYDRLLEWSQTYNWSGYKRNVTNPITNIIEESFEIQRRLDQVKVGRFTASYVDIMGRAMLKELQETDGAVDLPFDKRMKLWTDLATLHAKLNGESVDRTQIDVGISHLYKQIEQIDKSKFIEVKAPEKLLE